MQPNYYLDIRILDNLRMMVSLPSHLRNQNLQYCAWCFSKNARKICLALFTTSATKEMLTKKAKYSIPLNTKL